MSPRAGKASKIVTTVLLTALLGSCSFFHDGEYGEAGIEGALLGSDGRELVLFAWVGACDHDGKVTVTATPTQVKIIFLSGPGPGWGEACIASAELVKMTLKLREPIGGREILDGSESAIELLSEDEEIARQGKRLPEFRVSELTYDS